MIEEGDEILLQGKIAQPISRCRKKMFENWKYLRYCQILCNNVLPVILRKENIKKMVGFPT